MKRLLTILAGIVASVALIVAVGYESALPRSEGADLKEFASISTQLATLADSLDSVSNESSSLAQAYSALSRLDQSIQQVKDAMPRDPANVAVTEATGAAASKLDEATLNLGRVRSSLASHQATGLLALAEARKDVAILQSKAPTSLQDTQHYRALSPLVVIFTSGIKSLLTSWPAAIILVCFIVIRSGQLSRIVTNLTSLKVGTTQLEMTLSGKSAAQVEDNLTDVFSRYRRQINREAAHRIRVVRLQGKLAMVFDKYLRTLLGAHAAGVRCTIHVEDALFEESLYQAVDYYPNGRKSGRAWSVRFGLIGRAWRSGEDQVRGSVGDRAQLIRDWGMTGDEADSAGSGKKSFAGIVLRTESGLKAGVFYMDHKEENVFGDNGPLGDESAQSRAREVVNAVTNGCRAVDLPEAVLQAMERVVEIGPRIRIYGTIIE